MYGCQHASFFVPTHHHLKLLQARTLRLPASKAPMNAQCVMNPRGQTQQTPATKARKNTPLAVDSGIDHLRPRSLRSPASARFSMKAPTAFSWTRLSRPGTHDRFSRNCSHEAVVAKPPAEVVCGSQGVPLFEGRAVKDELAPVTGERLRREKVWISALGLHEFVVFGSPECRYIQVWRAVWGGRNDVTEDRVSAT